ncbi:uncharacterized protein V6R79_015204 [Siganus canaliculatus]
MQLVLRVLVALGLVSLMNAGHKEQRVSVQMDQGTQMKGQTVKLLLDPSVEPHVTAMSDSPIANRSLSPWTYRQSCADSRFPRLIPYAQCLTSSCLSTHDGGEDAALEAKPIYYQVLVLRRVLKTRRVGGREGRKIRKKYFYRLGTEMIPVGCTCVRPSIVPQQ